MLVNDFGAAGIDGEIFSAGGIESVELPSGCVCCTLRVDLITTIQRIVKQFAPDHLLIEPSGVASPSGVLEALESAGTASASVIGLVDVAEFRKALPWLDLPRFLIINFKIVQKFEHRFCDFD